MAIIYTYPTKATPANDDLILISDSADSNKTKQVTVASIKGQTAGVTSIVAGNNVTISSTGASGTGDVTVNASGGGTFSVQDSGGTAITGIDTLNFNSNLSLIHAPGSSTITINASSGSSVDTFTNAFGTYITGTANSTATGAVDMGTVNLSASDGSSATTTTRFLSKDNEWAIPTYTTDTTYSIMGSGNGYLAGLVLAGDATHNDEFLRKDGTWQTAGGAVTSYTNAGSNRILTSSGTGVINGESSLLYSGSILTLGTNSTFQGSRNNADNVQTTNGIIELSNSSTVAYAYQANLDSNSRTTGANKHIIFRYDGTEISYIRNASANSVEFPTGPSDERKKKNIVDWNDKILDSFSLIEPKKFNYLNENDSDELTKGFIAQKMVDKFPEAYPKDPDTENELGYYSFNPSGMTVYLMKAVKELKEEIDTLKSRISTLEG
jgi:hypothetical protein